jgi:carbon-monoxide dehydrogenase small subunit
MMKHRIRFTINGEVREMEVKANQRLLDLIRNDLDLTGTKEGCAGGECGACTVLVDGKAINSCLMLAVEADGKEILTIEGLAEGVVLDPIQESFVEHGALQCGFCIPGMIMSAKALLKKNPHPSEKEVREAISGNLCRCTGYEKIIEAILNVTQKQA